MQGTNTIESYNGIMLCKRPPPGAIPTIQDRMVTKQFDSFSSKSNRTNAQEGLYWKPCGSTRILPEKAKVISRLSKNDGALRRHKQWLKQMQIKKEQQIRKQEEETRLKEEKKTEFMERQSKRRARAREAESKPIHDECDNISEHESLENVNLGGKRSRPAWSLTETKANEFQECMAAEEEQELMGFVENLNFQSFFDDMELKILMSQVKDRIRALEKDKNVDESRLRTVMDSEDASTRDDKYNSSDCIFDCEVLVHESPQNESEEVDIQSIADSIRSDSNVSVSTIHSRRSLQMLVSKAKKRLSDSDKKKPLNVIDEGKSSGGEMSMKIPLTITHKEDDGARLAETKSLNKLPFKNRNPAL